MACTAFYGKEKQLGQVTIFIINSAVEHMDQLKGYSFLVFDEVHHLGAEQFSRLLKMDAPYMLGLTATVKRLDEAHHTIMRVMPIIYQMSVGDARKNGYMSRMEVRDIRVEMSAEFRMEYDKLSRRIMNLFRDLPHYTNLFRLKGNPKAQEAIQLISRRRLLLANIPEKIFKVKQVIDENPTEKILLFSETIRSIQAIQQYLNSQSIQTGVYHSHMKHADREEALSSWREGKFPILLSVRCLEEGIDVPECNVGVFYASGSSDRQLIQRLGRILRPQPGKTAKLYVIFCPRTTEQRHAWRIRNL